jgi:AraC-like DNA-binding protein
MKILPFQVPKTGQESFHIQVDDNEHFYEYLHAHPEIQITYMIEGKGTLIAGDYIGPFSPGRLYVIGSEQPHVFKSNPEYFTGSGLRAHSVSIFIQKEMLGAALMQLPETNTLNDFVQRTHRGMAFGEKSSEPLQPLVEEIFATQGMKRLIALLALLDRLSENTDYTYLSADISKLKFNEKEGKRLDAVYSFSLNELHRQISIDEVAKIASMTPSSFCRFFKKRTRKSYIAFLNEIRIGNACKLLQYSDLPVSEISYQCGFTNLSNFNRQFRIQKGISPSQFRKNCRTDTMVTDKPL